MSSRVPRKLQGDKDSVHHTQNDCNDPEFELECAGGAKKKQLNVKAMMYDGFYFLPILSV
jgi:hypothetical protein